MDEKVLEEIVMSKIKEWFASQQNQKDGYEYERSLDEAVRNIAKSIIQEEIGPLPENDKQKKSFDEFWRNNYNKKPLP